MRYPELFLWWAVTITWSSIFLAVVSIYLYVNSGERREGRNRTRASMVRLGRNFVFVWVLLGLLVLYIVSVNMGSSVLFAAGNILVETVLIVYIMKSRTGGSAELPPAQS